MQSGYLSLKAVQITHQLFKYIYFFNESLSDVDKFSYPRGLLLELVRSAIEGFSLTAAKNTVAAELLKKDLARRS